MLYGPRVYTVHAVLIPLVGIATTWYRAAAAVMPIKKGTPKIIFHNDSS